MTLLRLAVVCVIGVLLHAAPAAAQTRRIAVLVGQTTPVDLR